MMGKERDLDNNRETGKYKVSDRGKHVGNGATETIHAMHNISRRQNKAKK